MRLVATTALVLFLGSGVAAAEGQDARTLAEEGQGLLDEGNVPAACAKLAASARLAPKISTRMMLALCFERMGRTATAWSEYQVVAKMANQAGDKEWQREMMAIERARALEKKLVRLTITAPNATPGLRIQRGSVLVPAAERGVAVPVDPGEIVVTATAEGYEPFTVSVRIAKEKLTTVEVPALRKAEPRPASPPPPAPVQPPDA